MSTVLNTNGETLAVPQVISRDGEFFILTADWNGEITGALRDGARQTLLQAGVTDDRINMRSVPGTVELVNAAATIVKVYGNHPGIKLCGVIVLGCVIKGETPHFDYVCRIAADGVAAINAQGSTPVIFGVLTVDDCQQALDRAGGRLGNKGAEAAAAAVAMANLHSTI